MKNNVSLPIAHKSIHLHLLKHYYYFSELQLLYRDQLCSDFVANFPFPRRQSNMEISHLSKGSGRANENQTFSQETITFKGL